MTNKSVRIQTIAGGNDKYLTLKLENSVDFFEILSLKISQKDIYGSFNSDYGVVIGRVIANGGVGIPNAKISVFIPISDEDKSRSDIVALYPYTSPRDKDLNGVRYNLLPRVSVNNPFIVEGDYAPKVPVGTFPTKEEITTNETHLEVYEKYYKFTTVSNNSGDYMLFGVPVGIQTLHMSVDVTDIGKYSMNPATMIKNLGYSPNLFSDDGTRIKYSTDLETLPNVELQEIAVEVRPFWGDSDNFEIGITRQDFKIRAVLATNFIVFGSAFTESKRGTWGQNAINAGDDYEEMWRINTDINVNLGIASKRNGTINTDIYYIPSRISDIDINSGDFDPINDVVKLQDHEYVKYVDAGQFVYVINTNRRKIITNEFGEEVEVEPTNPSGIFTEFRGMFYSKYGENGELDLPAHGDIARYFSSLSNGLYDNHTFFGQRWRMKIPQYHPDDISDPNNKFNCDYFNPLTAKYGSNATSLGIRSHGKEGTPQRLENNDNWRKMNYKFSASNYYSIAKYNPLAWKANNFDNINAGTDPFWNTGIIITTGDGNWDPTNPDYQLPYNTITSTEGSFGAQWLNFCLYFPQHTFYYSNQKPSKSNNNPVTEDSSNNDQVMYFDNVNNIPLVSKTTGTALFLRNDFHKTMFVRVPKEDVINIINKTLESTSPKGFMSNQYPYDTDLLIGNYMYRNHTNSNAVIQGLNTNISYFYKGFSTADCFVYLNSLGLV